MKRFALVFAILMTLSRQGNAGIYSPDERFLFEIENGIAKAIQFTGGYESFLSDYRDIGTPLSRLTDVLEERIQSRMRKGVNQLSPEELAGLSADLLRTSKNDRVLNLLQPLARDRTHGGFLVYTHIARAHAGRAEWHEAYDQQLAAIKFSEFPQKFGKLSKDQLAWLKRVERDYYLPWLLQRAEDARKGRIQDLREDLDLLFTPSRTREKLAPLKFVGNDGQYTAGTLADEERNKLPADAVAIVQQILLWHPKDARLYWLLGELYNANGDVETAVKILDNCSFVQGYSNPIMKDHRRILQSAMDVITQKKEEEAKKVREKEEAEKAQMEQEEKEYKDRFWWIVSCGIGLGLLLIYYQFREIIRRMSRKS